LQGHLPSYPLGDPSPGRPIRPRRPSGESAFAAAPWLHLSLVAALLTLSVAADLIPSPSPTTLHQIPAPWWNANWSYVRTITVSTGANPPLNGYDSYSVYLVADTSDVSRFRADCFDLRIVYWDGAAYVELDRDLYGCGTAATQVWFRLQADIPPSSSDANYYLYYGNPAAAAPPADRNQVYLWWDDFATNPFAAGSPRYSRVKAVDIHGDAYVAPTYDAANQRVSFNTGDNFTSDMYVNTAAFSNAEQDVFIQVDHFGNLSYPSNATDAIVARVSALTTTSTHEYIHFSHGTYSPSPGCAIDSWGPGGERNALCGGVAPAVYWAFNTAETWAWGLSDTTHRFWRNPATTFVSPDPAGRTQLLTGALSTPQNGYIGLAPAQTRGWWDNLLIRRYTEPEPSAVLGQEYPFASPLVSDPKIDSLFADNDSNGVPSPGDDLSYAILISQSSNSAIADVAFSDTPGANTTLIVGSVTTTLGAVISGNNPGDTSIAVDIGLLPTGVTVAITFRVRIDDPVPPGIDRVSNQGSVTGTGIPSTPTDDPATPDPSDPTVTLLGRLAEQLPSTGFAPAGWTRQPQLTSPAPPLFGDIWLEIPSLGLHAAIVGVPLGPEGWDVGWLSHQVGYLEGTAYPGRPGNSGLTAHVTLADGTPGPFDRIDELRWDDEIIIHSAGMQFRYLVRRVERVTPDDLSPLSHEELSWLTLLTCAQLDADTQSYGLRLAVRAALGSVTPSP
jgi:LPXTG-site transpeptidase (sortase) family protein